MFAAWATTRGTVLVDREIYLPQVWTGDRERCEAAQVPETVGFATKPRLAEKMIDRILPELPENTWLAADEVYGRDGAFRSFAENRQLPYVVNVSSAQTVRPRMIKVYEAVDHNRSRVLMPSSLITTVTRYQDHIPGDLADDAEHLGTLADILDGWPAPPWPPDGMSRPVRGCSRPSAQRP